MQNNQIIVAGRDTGKTTYLLIEIDRLHQEGVNIVVMDSATEHEEKSLLKKTCNNINESVVIDMRDPNGIVIDKVGLVYTENGRLDISKKAADFTKFAAFLL